MTTINLDNFDVGDLPSVSIENKSDLPRSPGIYFLVDSQERIQYVGQSQNIAARWSGHHKLKDIEGMSDLRIAFWQHYGDLDEIEKELIRHLRPPLNVVLYGGLSQDDDREFRAKVPVDLHRLVSSLIPLRDLSVKAVLIEAFSLWLQTPENQELISKNETFKAIAQKLGVLKLGQPGTPHRRKAVRPEDTRNP